MARSAASERGQYRAALRDYAKVYNAKTTGFWLTGRRSFPNLHMRRKHPGWLRDWSIQTRAPYAERKARERKRKFYGQYWHTTLDDARPLTKRELRQRRATARTETGERG